MRFAFLIYHFFPHGGQQRDFLRIARACAARGHDIDVYTLRWNADAALVEDTGAGSIRITEIPARAWTRHRLYERFRRAVDGYLAERPVDAVVGFTRMQGLDVYFGADTCYAERIARQRPPGYRWLPRSRHFLRDEAAVFGAGSATRILLLSAVQRDDYLRHYAQAAPRITLLPPGIDPERKPPSDAAARRRRLRDSLGLATDDDLVLQIGSGHRTKGVDRALRAVAALPPERRRRVRYVLVGEPRIAQLIRQARRLGIVEQCVFCGPQDDVTSFLCAADFMLHPARTESAGHALLEGVINGVPVLTTADCGYAEHIRTAEAGSVVGRPFRQEALNEQLRMMLADTERRAKWRENGLAYGRQAALYDLPVVAAEQIEQSAGRAS